MDINRGIVIIFWIWFVFKICFILIFFLNEIINGSLVSIIRFFIFVFDNGGLLLFRENKEG